MIFRMSHTIDLYAILLFLLIASFPPQVEAQSGDKPCKISGCLTNKSCQYLEYSELNLSQIAHQRLCLKVEQGDMDLTEAQGIMDRLITNYTLCNGSNINPLLSEKTLNDDLCPKRLENVFKEYCKRTYDPKNYYKASNTKKYGQWLSKEIFCQITYCVVDSGTWIEVFKPDIPAEKKFESETKNLCKELKAGKISYEDARYEWEQTLLRFKEKAGPELVKKYSLGAAEIMLEIIKKSYSK